MYAVSDHEAENLAQEHTYRMELLRLGRSKRRLDTQDFETWLESAEALYGWSDIEVGIVYEGYDGVTS